MNRLEFDYVTEVNRGRILDAWNRATQLFKDKMGSDWETNEILSLFGLKTPFQTARGK